MKTMEKIPVAGTARFRELMAQLGGGLMELAWPTRCAICDRPGELLCSRCDVSLPRISQVDSCPLCGAPHGRIECTECWNREGKVEHPFFHATCALEYGRDAARLVKCFKDGGELGLASVLARLVWDALLEDPGQPIRGGGPMLRTSVGPAGLEPVVSSDASVSTVSSVSTRTPASSAVPIASDVSDASDASKTFDALTYIPATPGARLRRGYDHMVLVAGELSALSGIPVIPALSKRDTEDQRSLDRVSRIENMEGSFGIAVDRGNLEGARLLLVDDVFTTGATLDAATEALLQAGVRDVAVATVCRVW